MVFSGPGHHHQPGQPVRASDGETVTVNVGSASCIVTLNATGFGSCSIGNTDLAVGGPYSVSASYAGDSNLQG